MRGLVGVKIHRVEIDDFEPEFLLHELREIEQRDFPRGSFFRKMRRQRSGIKS